jgi:alpha-beta hydrolase superfamily lysophospholipase
MTVLGRWALRLAGVMVVGYGCACCVAAGLLADLALHPDHRPLAPIDVVSTSLTPDDVELTAKDGAVLRAWYVAPAHPNGEGVILLHGMADNREGVAGYAEMFLRHGYAVLLPDSRAHGDSEGAIATYGVLERDDVRRWAAWLHSHAPGCEYLFGESMGAAIAVQASAVTPGICAVVAESSFATFREIADDRIAQETGLGLWFSHSLGAPARELAIAYVDLRYRVNLAEANPLQAIRASRVPTLLICGTADDNIPMRHSQQLYRAGAWHAQLWIVTGAEHTGASAVDPSAFERRVVGWFALHGQPQ